MEKLAPNVRRQVVNLDFRPPGAPQRGHPAARQLRRRQGLRRCGRHRGHGEGQGVRPTRGGAGRWVKQQEIVVQWGRSLRVYSGGYSGVYTGG